MSVAGSCFHLSLVTATKNDQRVQPGNMTATYSATVHHGKDPDKTRQVTRKGSYKLSRPS